MARIRSVHPGLFTDPEFLTCSPLARFLAIGIWTECDDQGIFDWSPGRLKIKLLPLDNADINALLAELEAADVVKLFSVAGKSYGAVRNFGKYQRPKKPNAVHPLPAEFRTYVTTGMLSSPPPPLSSALATPPTPPSAQPVSPPPASQQPPVPHQSPTSGEKPNQMEEGGDKMKEEGGRKRSVSHSFSEAARVDAEARAARKQAAATQDATPPPADPMGVGLIPGSKIDPDTGKMAVNGIILEVFVRECAQAADMDPARSGLPDWKTAAGWVAAGLDCDEVIRIIRRLAERRGYAPPHRLSYFDAIIRADSRPQLQENQR